MPMIEDLSVFLNVDEFAHRAVLDNVAVAGIFDNATGNAIGSDVMVAEPSFLLPTADCTRVRDGTSRLRIDGVPYIVRTSEADGQGLTALHLTRDVRT